MVCEASNQELIAEAVRVTSAPQERQYASHFRVRVNHDFARRSQARYDRPMKFGPIAIHGRIDGTVVSGLASSGEIVIHPDSEVRGILALLRSRSHPDGFRYELLITSLTDHGKSYVLTASLRPSLTDSPVAPPSNHGTGVSGKSSESGTH